MRLGLFMAKNRTRSRGQTRSSTGLKILRPPGPTSSVKALSPEDCTTVGISLTRGRAPQPKRDIPMHPIIVHLSSHLNPRLMSSVSPWALCPRSGSQPELTASPHHGPCSYSLSSTVQHAQLHRNYPDQRTKGHYSLRGSASASGAFLPSRLLALQLGNGFLDFCFQDALLFLIGHIHAFFLIYSSTPPYPHCVCVFGPRTKCKGQISSSTIRALGIELTSSGLAVKAVTL